MDRLLQLRCSWSDSNPERFTKRMVHRNYLEQKGLPTSAESGVACPTPGSRIAFVAEQPGKAQSPPHIVARDPGDWGGPSRHLDRC
ncbi:hypothetical protein SAMN04488103_12012 [Gemmobacter aquatilis]|uniref:Uncharacterized protein n=1 Tax=Gemmobacter aquatilis TaxID=933059 RepID=A0A1H8NJT1_9RHOB|nr:hypothetical protein SAMN04488103_12012 [Gemmobacter aquatilis]